MNIDEKKLTKPVVCDEHDTVSAIAHVMQKNNVRQVLITKQENPIGIVSMTDIVFRVVAKKKNPEETKAIDIMTSPINSIDISTPLEKAYLQMIQKNVYSIPVTQQGKLVGILPFSLSQTKSNK